MREDINKLQVVQFSAELSSKYLIILYMNKINVLTFETQGGITLSEYPNILATGSVNAALEGRLFCMKWTLEYTNNLYEYPYGLELKLLIFNLDRPPAAILGSNGQKIRGGRDLVHSFSVNLHGADRLAKDIATYFIQILKGEVKENDKPTF